MIVRWTFRNLFDDPRAMIGSAAAIAAAFTLVILFEGIWLGEAGQVVAYAEHTDADVWVMQRGVSNMHMATSLIPDDKRAKVARVEGVASVTPILYLNTMLKAGNRQSFSYIVGLFEKDQLGGPWAMAAGVRSLEPGEAIIPKVLASLSGVGIGDRIRMADRSLRVVGLSSGTYSMANPVTFVHASDIEELLSTFNYDSYLLVQTRPDADASSVARRIEVEIDGTAALTKADFVSSDRAMALQMGVEVIGLITAIGTVLAAVLVAFTLYVHTARRRRELSILKALGFRNRHLLGSVLLQGLTLAALGLVLSVVLAYLSSVAIARWVPQVAMALSLASFLKVALGGLVIALLAALVPARQVSRVDPHSVFQG